MQSRKQFLIHAGAGLMAGISSHQNFLNPFENTPKLEFSFKAEITLDPVQDLGMTAHGHRRIIPINGGHFEGPQIKGVVLSGGADWQIIRPDKVAELNAQYTLKTEDGALIYINNKGYRHGPAAIMQKLANGEIVSPDLYYFRCTPLFETSEIKYDYLNKYIFIGLGERKPDRVIIDFYKLL